MTTLDELKRMAARERRFVTGVAVGSALERISAAACRLEGAGDDRSVQVLAMHHERVPSGLRQRIDDARSPAELAAVDVELGELLAVAAERVGGQAGDEIELIAVSGAAIHRADPSSDEPAACLELGQSAVVAARCRRPVACGFAQADLAHGRAEGAGLAAADRALFAGGPLCLVEVEAETSLTVVGGGGEQPLQFEAGPGQRLIDEVCRELTGDDDARDQGEFSRLGEVDHGLLQRLLSHEYLQLPPPKTAAARAFGLAEARELIEAYDPQRLIDLLATAVHFVAGAVARAVEDFVQPRQPLEGVWLSGAGASNATLVRVLAERLPELPVGPLSAERFGAAAQARRAAGTAFLGDGLLRGEQAGRLVL